LPQRPVGRAAAISLSLIGSTTITGGGADVDARLSPDGRNLLVDGAGHNFVSVFAVSGQSD
jgi:hypothetical protein